MSVVADRIRRFVWVEEETPVDARFLKEVLGNVEDMMLMFKVPTRL